ncbi:uncharacterized protein LOC105279648 [Ooceraea biroi]|uniref:uncharacterized protein LOC105279648 n=1 Tax=Ooceraea biroi TaxID=2015173 RepID=UPI000F073202|nr:uncharacterized protein LOC105279648 [Ooceraea biroi]
MSAEELLDQQLQMKHSISRALENFKKTGRKNLTPAKIRSRMTSLKENWNQLRKGHASLSKRASAEMRSHHDYFNGDVLDEAEDAFQTAMDYMTECLEELEPPVSPANSTEISFTRANPSAFSLSHLPPIKLPPFDGKFEEWEQFRDRFQSLISENKELSNFSRMHFLASCLKGRALESIADLSITGDNFDIAWKTLTSRFESKRRILNVHLSAILNLTSLTRESSSELHSLRDRVRVAVSALRHIDRTPEDLWNDVLVHSVVQRLDSVTRKAWNVKTSDSDEPPHFDDLDRFLLARARALEDCSSAKASSKSTAGQKITVSTASKTAPATCPLCKARHFMSACPTFTAGSPIQRRELVKHHKRCYNCLSQSHAVGECQSKYSCRTCQQRHHSLLHDSSDSRADTSAAASVANASPTPPPHQPVASDTTIQSLCSSTPKARSQVLLATAWVTVGASSGRSFAVRALLDQGSEMMTFISECLVQNLRAKRITMPVAVSAIGGVLAGNFNKAVVISVSPRKSTAPSLSAPAVIMPQLTSYAPRKVIDLHSLSHLANLSWADPDPGSAEPIDVIIGADLYGSVILDGIRRGGQGDPIAQNSIFGWLISGPVGLTASSNASSACLATDAHPAVSVHHISVSPSLDAELRRFWEVEEVPRKALLTPEEIRCENHFIHTHSRTPGGRYIVRLPFKTELPINIGATRFIAEKQAESLSRRFHANPVLFKEYAEFLNEYESLGHMRRVPLGEPTDHCVYIPHHPVLRESSATSRLRVVFNASSRSSNGTSLNDHLLPGPKLQSEFASVILKWRSFRYVYTADIAKMFRQILVDPLDTQYQHILWKPNVNEAPIDFELLTVTYGMACSPYEALRVIKQVASDEGHRFPCARAILLENSYVDDVCFGYHRVSELRKIRDELTELLRRGGFELRKWASNSAELLSDIDPQNHGLACTKQLAPDENLKILGIGWNPRLDVFQVSVSIDEKIPSTKRTVLSAISRIYDPLGWVVPATIAAKIFMQQLWQAKVEWDEEIPASLVSRWKAIYSRLPQLNQVRLSRWTSVESEFESAELHGFSDASNSAYAAVIYLRVVSSSGDVTITLLAAKSRVAPVTPLTVPRLELSAAVLLSRLLEFVRESINFEISSCTCWTDSTIVLAWLDRHPSQWKTFVANRVAEIRNRAPNAEWQYVSTLDNPADCASRGLISNELISHPLWWHGPPWLSLSKEAWPQLENSLTADAPLEEKTGHVASDRVEWHFLPPSAPHFGGIWEAGVKSVKHHLRRVVGNQTLTFEELTTLLYNVEACLNSRPIAPLSDSFDEVECLTPGHFLIGAPITIHPEPSLLALNEDRLSRWQRVRQLTERFWKLWAADYVNTLQQRQKWRKSTPSLKPGQMVLLRNPLLPPCKWELGRVIRCHPGKDGLVRVVTVKTATSEFKRPLGKLCLLPVECEA